MTRIYLDACSIIYLVEATGPFHAVVKASLARHASASMARIITSRLSLLECRVRPIRLRDAVVLSAYEAFFDTTDLVIGEITESVIERATLIRADFGFATPDAIHLATAIDEQEDVFLTGDTELARYHGIRVEVLTAA